MCVYNSEWPHNFTEPKPHLNQFSQIKYSNLETELNVMKKFKQNYQIQVQIRLVRKIKSKSIKKLQIRKIYIQIQIHVHLWWAAMLPFPV